jgi:GH35 family endo-1,4-beta-xylanase
MVYIPGLSDANYSFRVYLRDDAGRTVSQGKVVARAYGERYLQSLQPWSNEASFHDGNVTVRWGASQRTVAGAEIRYSKDDGTAVALRVQPDAETTFLSDYKPGSFFAYRTLYLPVQEAIDTFYTAYKTVPVISGRLKDLAEEKNILIGSLISYGNPWANSHGVIQDGSPGNIYTQLARDEFNLGQATWGAAWGGWNDENVYDFNGVNAVINWCLSNHQTVMVHNILGNNTYMPDWFINGSYTPEQMEVMLQNLVSHFMESNNNKSKVAIWDVVNEAFSDQNGTYREMKWNDMGWEDDASGLPADQVINVKHPVFIGKALEYCRQKTNAKLEIRDYGIEIDHPYARYYNKHKAFYQLIRHLQAKRYPIDCIGIQAHRTIGIEQTGGPEVFRNTIQKFRQTGLEVMITELDIAIDDGVVWNETVAGEQKNNYYMTVKTAIEAGVNIISLWGFRDSNDPTWLTTRHPLLFDQDYKEKPAYQGVREAIFEAKTEK